MTDAKKVSKKKKPVEIVVIADRSGSMQSIAADAIGGFNSFVAEQKAVKGAANLTLVLFDDIIEIPIDSMKLKDVPDLTSETYKPRGTTALNDAIGITLSKLEAKNPDKAIVCILTDGQENASKEYTIEKAKEKIVAAEARGWQVIYLAANQDAFAVGSMYGVLAGNSQNFAATSVGVTLGATYLSTRSTTYRSDITN